VGSDRHANAGPANEYATFRFVLGDLAADGGCDVGVIDALTVVRPLVADFVPPLLQQLNQLCLDVEAAMIAADGDTHIRSTSVKIRSDGVESRITTSSRTARCCRGLEESPTPQDAHQTSRHNDDRGRAYPRSAVQNRRDHDSIARPVRPT